MQIAGSSSAGAAFALQRLFAGRDGAAPPTGSDFPGAGQKLPSGGPPKDVSGFGGGPPFSSATLGAVIGLQLQGGPPSASQIASDLVSNFDSDGDGALSSSEIKSGLANGDASGVDQALSGLDQDGDGKLGADELAAGVESDMKAMQSQRGAAPAHQRSIGVGSHGGALDVDQLLALLGQNKNDKSSSSDGKDDFSRLLSLAAQG